MAVIAPEAKAESKEEGWLDPFLAGWNTGTGAER
jgi:hypothetical protein